MQIVLSGNRVIAHGDNCFLAMGGTVICEETGKAYQNATIAECENCPADIGSVGYEYHAGVFVPCAPYGKDNGNGTILVACEECGAPKDSGLRIDEIIGARLNVTAPVGCEVICTNGDKTVKGIYKNGVYVCNLTDYGKWTVTAGRWHGLVYETQTGTVTVDIVKQYALAFGATISVEYPENSTVTCTLGDVVLTAPDTSGVWEFDVLAFGEWELYCTNGTDETSRVINITTGGQAESVELAYFAATITVTYPAKSTCTCKNGSTTLTNTNTGTSAKTATFTVPNSGTWTIKATATDDSGNTASTTVSITANGQSKSVTLTYTIWLYNAGDECTSTTGGWTTKSMALTSGDTNPKAPTLTKSTSTLDISIAKSYYSGIVYCTNKIDLTNRKTLKVEFTKSDSNASGFGLVVWTSLGTYVADNKAAGTNSNTSPISVSVSSLSGKHVVGFSVFSQTADTSVKVKKCYLE